MNIQQRLAPNDITGHILSDAVLASQYCFIVLPAIFSKHTYLICPISGDIYEFNAGDTLWPERFGNYESLKAEVGMTVFETQYLQNPIASDRTVIKNDMIICKAKTEVPSINDADTIYASHDFPVKDKDSSDFLGSTLAYKVGSTLYIKDSLEKKMAFVKSVEYVKQLDTFYPGIIQIIEDKANGSPILQQLQDEVPGMQAYQPGTRSKMQRLESASLYMTAGNVVFVMSLFDETTQSYKMTTSIQNLIQRLLNFPFVEHDDIVDAFSQLILFCFMDKRYMVYGRAFNDNNIVDTSDKQNLFSTTFFNKEGDIWKICTIGIDYGIDTKLYVMKELRFKGSVKDGLEALRRFAPNDSVFVDCSETEAMYGMTDKNISIVRYTIEDYDKSISQMNLAFANKKVLVDKHCHLTQNDIESFKFSKSKDDNVKYITKKDGFVACLRVAMHYFGGIV